MLKYGTSFQVIVEVIMLVGVAYDLVRSLLNLIYLNISPEFYIYRST